MIDLLSDKVFLDPFPLYQRMRDTMPICEIEPGGMWALSRYSDVQQTLRDTRRFSSKASLDILAPDWLKASCHRHLGLSTYDPPFHAPHRQVVTRAFAARIINGLEPAISDIGRPLVEEVVSRGSVELIEDFSLRYFGQIIALITGTLERQPIKDLYQWLQAACGMGFQAPPREQIERLEFLIERQIKIFDDIISDRMKNPGNDLVSELIATRVSGEHLNRNALNNILEVIVRGGYTPPTHMLTQILITLSRQPGLLKKLKQYPEKIPDFVEEALRLYPSVHSLMRKTTEAVTFYNTTIPANTIVLPVIAASNRDPAQFNCADSFNLNRKNKHSHLAFGFGPHLCIGALLSRIQFRVILEQLLPRINHIECPGIKDIRWIRSMFFRGTDYLPITFS